MYSAGASTGMRTPSARHRSQLDLVTRLLQRETETGSGLSLPDVRTLADDVGEMGDETDYMARLVRDLLVLAHSAADATGSVNYPIAKARGLHLPGSGGAFRSAVYACAQVPAHPYLVRIRRPVDCCRV